MALTDDEARQLGEIRADLRASNPHLARALGNGDAVFAARVITAVVTWALLVPGVLLQVPAVYAAGWCVLAVNGVLAAVGLRHKHCRTPD